MYSRYAIGHAITSGSLTMFLWSSGCGDDGPPPAAGSTTGESTGPSMTSTTADVTPPPITGETTDATPMTGTTGAVLDTGTTDPPDPDSSDSSSGGPPFPCDDPKLPVTVEGGGSYDSIQGAIDATPDGGTVLICPGEYAETLQIVRDITIIGAGMAEVSIVGVKKDFVVIDANDVDLTISDLTVRGGQFGLWVGDANDHTIAVARVSIEDNAQYGLYVWASNNASVETTLLDVVDSNISGIDAAGDGAGILVELLTATITDTTIIGNQAVGSGGGLRIGGAIVTVSGGQIHDNQAGLGGGALLETNAGLNAFLTVVDGDWGAGMAVENYEADVRCWPDPPGGFPVPTAGFLGLGANAECNSQSGLGQDCCLP